MKRDRHERILELIATKEINRQEQLAQILRSEGFKVTQATVSRDIRDLNLTKVAVPGGRQKYAASTLASGIMKDKYVNVLKTVFSSADTAGHMLVIKTVPGMAMAAAAAVDALEFEGHVGCIAGDDTIMVATRTPEIAESSKAILYELAGKKPRPEHAE